VQNRPIKSLMQEKRLWIWERGYEKGQGLRKSQDYGRCRNGKGRLRQKLVDGVVHTLKHMSYVYL